MFQIESIVVYFNELNFVTRFTMTTLFRLIFLPTLTMLVAANNGAANATTECYTCYEVYLTDNNGTRSEYGVGWISCTNSVNYTMQILTCENCLSASWGYNIVTEDLGVPTGEYTHKLKGCIDEKMTKEYLQSKVGSHTNITGFIREDCNTALCNEDSASGAGEGGGIGMVLISKNQLNKLVWMPGPM
eukprot:sb/3471265/